MLNRRKAKAASMQKRQLENRIQLSTKPLHASQFPIISLTCKLLSRMEILALIFSEEGMDYAHPHL
jgi:hypothetical protein